MTQAIHAGRGTTAKGLTLIYAQVLPVMAIVSLFPAIPSLFRQFASYPHAGLLIPAIVTIPSLFAALFAPLAGIIADRFGRRPSFIFGMVLYVVAGLVPLFISALVPILISRAVLGLADAFAITISSALIGDYFGDLRHRWTAWVGVATSVAGTALIAAGGALADISWRGPFAIYLAAIPGLIMVIAFIDEPVAHARADRQPARPLGFPWREAGIIGVVTFFASVLYYVEPLNIARVLDMRGAGSATRIGLIQAATSLSYIAGAFLYRRLYKRPIGQLLGLAGLMIGAGQLVIGLTPTWQTVSIGAVIQQLGGAMVIPALLAWGQFILPLEQHGRGMGIWATAFFSGTFLCSPMVSAVFTAPIEIDANWWGDPADKAFMIEMVKLVRRYMRQPALAKFVAEEVVPGPAVETDAQIGEVLDWLTSPGIHGTGTCRMGLPGDSVVDSRLRVHGVAGLRVVDCPIMPAPPAGNTNGPAMAIGWRAAELIKQDWQDR